MNLLRHRHQRYTVCTLFSASNKRSLFQSLPTVRFGFRFYPEKRKLYFFGLPESQKRSFSIGDEHRHGTLLKESSIIFYDMLKIKFTPMCLKYYPINSFISIYMKGSANFVKSRRQKWPFPVRNLKWKAIILTSDVDPQNLMNADPDPPKVKWKKRKLLQILFFISSLLSEGTIAECKQGKQVFHYK